ncbi:hypothetical protein RB614_26535 [Phytohabitans sp. ZYX-F-186]|uniref:NACHT N-terminal Helical domain-containing protein n=1 Tax=Phytohabitans maris TaxID=3071409 RepID=A0ABU0ZPE1_9ACTN|nr:hypothetical protein [Phytohabitans sp. ZYX-F-186]MDQ7908090.1 hypothetical protein [Phytohabitans sp. ZYX-F-186]
MARDARQLGAAVAKVALAGLFGGVPGGLQEAGAQAIEFAFGASDGRSRQQLKRITGAVEEALARFAAAEHLDQDAVGRALGAVSDVLAAHPLTAADLVAVNLDADRAVALVTARAAGPLADLDEADRRLCGLGLDATVRALVEAGGELPDLEREFQRALLSRLADQREASDELRHTLDVMRAGAILTEATWPWWQDQYPPSALLRAQYGIVPFHGRERALDELLGWLSTGPMTALTALTGSGGMGKTRLSIELCARARNASWRAGFLHPSVQAVSTDQLELLATGSRGVLVVVDYAETRRPATASLIQAALRAHVRVRLVLLARSAGDWWLELRHSSGPVGDFVNGPAVARREIDPLAVDPAARSETHRRAAAAFAGVLGLATPDGLADGLGGPLFDRVLFIHLRALALVLGDPAATEGALLDFALRREQSYLDGGLHAAGLAGLAGQPIRQAAALATMAGGATSLGQAIELLRQAPLLADQPQAVLARVATVLHGLYPADAWLAGVQPDLLGEHLVAATIDDDPLLLGAFGAVR